MPIPRINKQVQFQAPKSAEGKAVDASKQIAQAYEPALNTVKLLNEAGNSALKFAIAQSRADAQYNAQNALNEYIEGINALDLEFQKYTYEEAQKQLPNYYSQAQKLHNKYVQSIDNIDVTDIREQYRQQVNSFNIKQKEKVELYAYSQKKEAQKQTFEKSQDREAEQASRAVNPYASGEENLETFTSALNIGYADADLYGADNFEPEEVIRARKQQFAGKAFENAVANIASGVDFNKSDNPYQNVLEFITAMRGKVPEDVWQKVANTYEKQSLNLAFAKNPSDFRVSNNPNMFNDKKAYPFAPHLSKWERWKHLKDVSDGTAANGNLQDGELSTQLKNMLDSAMSQNLKEAGYFTKDLIKYDNTVSVYEDSESEKRRKQRGSYSKVKSVVETLENIMNGNFWFNGQVIADSSMSEQEKINNGFRLISVKPADKEELKKYEDTYNNLKYILGEMTYNGTVDDSEYTTSLDAIKPPMILDIETFMYQYNYEKTKTGWFEKAKRFIRREPLRDIGMSPDLMYRSTKTLQNKFSEAVKGINDYRVSNGMKALDNSIYNKSTYELIQYFDNLSNIEAINYTDKNGKNFTDYWQIFEDAFATALGTALPPETIKEMSGSTLTQSPSQNYYDYNGSTKQGRQITLARDFFTQREKYRQDYLSKSYGQGTGGFAISNYDYEQVKQAKARREALNKPLSERQKTFAFEAISNRITED